MCKTTVPGPFCHTLDLFLLLSGMLLDLGLAQPLVHTLGKQAAQLLYSHKPSVPSLAGHMSMMHVSVCYADSVCSHLGTMIPFSITPLLLLM